MSVILLEKIIGFSSFIKFKKFAQLSSINEISFIELGEYVSIIGIYLFILSIIKIPFSLIFVIDFIAHSALCIPSTKTKSKELSGIFSNIEV